MPKMIIHDYEIPCKGVQKKILYHFSDLHLSMADELSSDAERQAAERNTASWREGRKHFARSTGEPCDEEQLIEAEAHFENLMQKAQEDGDALLIAGDLFDHVTGADIRWFEKRFSHLAIPYLLACGNHENPTKIPDNCALARIKQPVQTLDLGDLVIMTFENSQRVITKVQIDALMSQLTQGKPIIIAMHIPIQAEHNKAHKALDEYFRLNHAECSEETKEFVKILYANTDKIVAVLAGHLHFLNVCELTPGLTQYVSSQGLLGNINRYIIGE
ncbi:MAG: metallophosphoesterase [Clostridia bacterium]|nr:metallophosphoesterase [Clostridia bacterium]